jgi:hypothetical protein
MNTNQNSSVPKIVGGIVAVLVCCSCIAIAAAAALVYQSYKGLPISLTPFLPPAVDTVTPVPTVQINRPPADTISTDTLITLGQTLVPENDPYELACHLKGVCNVSKTVQDKSYKIGDQEKFWILNEDTTTFRQITATLQYITPHSYFWAENGAQFNKNDMKTLMDTFENKIYPKDREFFGSEWTPGVDNDPHIFIIYASDIGSNIAGFFDSSDEYSPAVKDHSNAHEDFVFSTTQDLADEYTYATLAHEFVHMIQFPTDRNDVSWIDEGFAEVGSFLNGYYSPGADYLYAQNPDLQLNTWVDSSSPDFGAHYGQSFLFLTYFLDRFGEDATKALTNNPANDLPSVDDTLAKLNITDKQTGKQITADDVFMDWADALYLKDGSVGDGRYTYHNYTKAPQASATETIDSCPQSKMDRTVNQYGIDYIQIACAGDHTLHFSGSTVAGLLPVDARSGKYMFWSNRGDESDMTLTHEFDLTSVSAPVDMTFSMWYDTETDYDYVFLEASTDGQTWTILKTPSGTDKNPSGNSYGWAYNGQTNGWKDETVDLSAFAGKKVQIRFEYVTDAALNGEGFLLDDFKIPAINYQTDFESDNGGWDAKGFVRVENSLPQTYRVDLITRKGSNTTVEHITLNADQTADIQLSLQSGDETTLVITGTTRFTRQPAPYQIEIK